MNPCSTSFFVCNEEMGMHQSSGGCAVTAAHQRIYPHGEPRFGSIADMTATPNGARETKKWGADFPPPTFHQPNGVAKNGGLAECVDTAREVVLVGRIACDLSIEMDHVS
jgi:hypothetical protein